MKIFHLLGSVSVGGAEVLFLDLAKYVNKKDNKYIEFGFYKDGSLKNSLLKLSNVRRISPRSKVDLIKKVRSQIKQEKISIIHCHSPFHIFYVWAAAIGLSTKLILTAHGYNEDLKSKAIYKTALLLSDQVLFVSSSFRKRLKQSIPFSDSPKYSVLYNGIDTDKIPLRSNKHEYGDPIKLGMVGNFHNNVRDQYTLCKAAALLKKQEVSFNLQFAGGASDGNTYFLDQCKEYVRKENLENSVEFLGFRDDVDELLQKWDLFVYSSNRDTFGIAVVEAMFSGIPVIVNDLDVFREITENGKYATLYRSKDAKELAEIIEDYVNDPQPFLKKAEEAKEFARKTYSIEAHYQKLISIYEELLMN